MSAETRLTEAEIAAMDRPALVEHLRAARAQWGGEGEATYDAASESDMRIVLLRHHRPSEEPPPAAPPRRKTARARAPRPPARPAPPPRDLTAETWMTGPTADRRGLAKFTHVARAHDDPERTDIRLLPEELRDRTATWRRGLAKRDPVEFRAPIHALLADGAARTFNAIGVLLLDKTADNLMDLPPDVALWTLVADGLVEHTVAGPILFRLTEAGRAAPPELVAAISPEALAFARMPIDEDGEDDEEEVDDEG